MADAEHIIRDLLRHVAETQHFTNYHLELAPLSSCGANYTSHLFLATITGNDRKLNIFAKVAAIGEKMRSQLPVSFYENEIFFYKKLMKLYQKLEDKNNLPDEFKMRYPEFYGYRDEIYEETLVLENLSSSGYLSHDRFKSVDWEYAAAAITELAKFHALSAAHQADDPEGAAQILSDRKFNISGDQEQLKPFWDLMMKRTLDATREENKARLEKFFEEYVGRETYMEYYNARKLNVLGHGDYRPSNLMHRHREDGTLEVVPVDYQTIRGGSPVVDLYYFIFTGTDAQFRAKYYQRLLDHYYEQLAAAMIRLHLDPREKYSREDFDAELKEKLPFGLSVAVFALPIVTVEAENAPKVDQNLELTDFSIQKTGATFPERLNGVVDDFVRWGVL